MGPCPHSLTMLWPAECPKIPTELSSKFHITAMIQNMWNAYQLHLWMFLERLFSLTHFLFSYRRSISPFFFTLIAPHVAWSSQDIQVAETKTFLKTFYHDLKNIEDFKSEIRSDILCYRGPSENPRWTDQELGCFSFGRLPVVEFWPGIFQTSILFMGQL